MQHFARSQGYQEGYEAGLKARVPDFNEQQRRLLRLCVGFMLANIRRSENTTLGVVLDAYRIAGLSGENPLFGANEELEDLIALLGESDA